MNLDWSLDEEAFAAEIRAMLSAELSEDIIDAGRNATSVYPDHEASMEWQAKLNALGLAAPHWPEEHGGRNWSAAQHYIFTSELAKAGAPSLSPMGIHMVAHVIAAFGTPEQKAYFLPGILSGEVFFCQGYSEPNAGSDLAALQMSAVPDGDDFILNGSKIWTTHAQEANWIFCLVRTNNEGRKQEGITFILVPMDQGGVTVRPLTMLSGETVQNQVFFEDVRVSRANVIGEVDRGWQVAKYLLEFERGGSAYSAGLKVRAQGIREQAARFPKGQGTLLDDPIFAQKLARAMIRIDVLEVMELKLLSAAGKGKSVGAMSSLMKILGTELAQHLTEIALEAAGPSGSVFQPHATRPGAEVPSYEAPADGYVSGGRWHAKAPLRYLNERAGSIYAGSNEIQRNILAKHVLGL
ncbi:acyl-CoA dehydrogenase family protein [Altererythrobacter sp. Z27]|uniref:acyl-CoA dehydrogenase family protein n=1 Tax=Altererythrobacter sp. Z27 TaxID=3461147 RepID=UPI004043F720